MSDDYKRTELQLFDAETMTNSTRLSATATKTSFISGVPFEIEPAMQLRDSNTVIFFPDVAQKLHDIDAEFVTRAAAAKTECDDLQEDVNDVFTTLNGTLGVLQSNLTAETAQRQAGNTADNTARDILETSLEALIAEEAAIARAAEQQNEADIVVAEQLLASKLSAEQAARTAAITNLETQIQFIKANTDSAAVDSITELLALVSGNPDTSLTALLTQLQADVAALQAVLNTLTNASGSYSLGN